MANAPCCFASGCNEFPQPMSPFFFNFCIEDFDGEWYGSSDNATDQNWIGSTCDALQDWFCQYGSYYSEYLSQCGMDCPYGIPTPTYLNEGLGNALSEGKIYPDGYDYSGTGYAIWHNYHNGYPPGSSGSLHLSVEDLGVGDGQDVQFFAQGRIDQDRADAGGVVRFYAWFMSPTDGWVQNVSVSVSSTDWEEVSVTLHRDDEYITNTIWNSCGWFRVRYDADEQRISECIVGTPTGYYWGHPTNPDGVAHDGRGTDDGVTNRGTCYTMDGDVVEDPFYQRGDAICMCGEGGQCERPAPTAVRFGIYHWPNDINDGTSSFANLYIPYRETVYGCMDPEALNYNPDANFDNDSCEYPPNQPPIISVNITAT